MIDIEEMKRRLEWSEQNIQNIKQRISETENNEYLQIRLGQAVMQRDVYAVGCAIMHKLERIA